MSCRISAPPPGTELGDGSQSTRESPTEDLVSLYKSPAGLVLLTPILKIRESRQEVLRSHRWWVALLRSQTRPSWTQGPCVLHPAPLLQADPLCSGAGLGPSSSIRGVCPTRLRRLSRPSFSCPGPRCQQPKLRGLVQVQMAPLPSHSLGFWHHLPSLGHLL